MAAWAYGPTGRLQTAYEKSKKSLELAIESDDIVIKQAAYSSFGYCSYLKRLFAEAEENFLEANRLYEKAGNIFWGTL